MAKKKVKEVPSEDLLRTNRIYISLREIGEVNEKGKSIFAIGYSGKNIAEPDRPLSTAVFRLIMHVAEMAKYTTHEDAVADLKRLKELVDSMNWTMHKGVTDVSAE